MAVTSNGNGTVFKWIAAALLTILMAAGGIVIDSVDSKIDSVKVDSTDARRHIEARVDANTAAIGTMQQDVAVIKYQTQQILDILKEELRDSS